MDKAQSDAKLFRGLQLVNEWLKFGEAKNGALVTLNGAAIAGMHNIAKIYGPPEGGLFWWWMWMATLCCIASMVVGLSSFYARTKVFGFTFSNNSPEDSSAIYFGHLANMRQNDLVQRLAPDADEKDKAYLDDMAGQIIINAKLASKKMLLFNAALLIAMAGAITPLGVLLYYWRFCDDQL